MQGEVRPCGAWRIVILSFILSESKLIKTGLSPGLGAGRWRESMGFGCEERMEMTDDTHR